MEPLHRRESTRLPIFSESGEAPPGFTPEQPARIRTPFSYRVCDGLTEGILYFMVVFTPWAFGTTQDWSVWTMNIAGYVLGALLAAKWLIRRQTGYRPSRWGAPPEPAPIKVEGPAEKITRTLTVGLAFLTILIPGYILVSAVNYRSTFLPEPQRFQYHDYIKWLPHSYDNLSTWRLFWISLGLACFFWAARDWLLGKTRRERHEVKDEGQPVLASLGASSFSLGSPEPLPPGSSIALPAIAALPDSGRIPVRLQRLLWVLCVNGALLALEAILQRLDGTNKLLWLVVPRFNDTARTQFGPYAYRSNAATYLNLVWPVCLGFWMVLRRAAIRKHRVGARVGGSSYVLLLPCAVVMATAPIFSISRGGAAVSLLNIIGAAAILFFATRREGAFARASTLSLFLFILGFSAYLGWQQLQTRLESIFVDNMSDRPQIYTNARPIARDFPIYGTGPGTFAPIYQLYKEPRQVWEAYLHDDFLETRITFGWVGFSIILLMLGIVLSRWFFAGGILSFWELAAFIWLAQAGCLFHAKFDFPFQIYSIQFLFLLLCSILFCLSRK